MVAKEVGRKVLKIPQGDDRQRLVCEDCNYIIYDNPKVVVGSIALRDNKVLLCKRAIEPRLGYWSFPGGFLEMQEGPIEGAKREAWEEARAQLEIDTLLAIYNIDRLSQIQLIYRAKVINEDTAPGLESEEIRYFAWDEIPWRELAFPTVKWALNHYHETKNEQAFRVRVNPPNEVGNMHEKF